ncbi:ADP-ribosylglycohydrolase [Trichoderma parareesei]|uniref:ADP-ribosylglycohydrolase n=1 Tax=Trichoderma parareesei TaxID=858221 RepID=A0A2H2Z2B7_TRIPA|nr:ADP-ribosylglycohydrolase [Trichoderma parareesei]
MSVTPGGYLERVYAGVLGKLIGVYVGRPFEGWTHQQIVTQLGHIRGYVHDKVGAPLVVTDDDVSGTFQFVRALEEHGCSPDISPEQIGKTWLNNVIENRTTFWWGGRGMSTEHTAFMNLKRGIPAPLSGAIEMNGKTVAEQIGAQIFIDGWAMVAHGNPKLAAKLARAAASVSHDGEAVYAAQLWAAMEAEAFVSRDINHILDVGLSFIPATSHVAHVIGKVRTWVAEDGDWTKTRQRIEDEFGYDKFHGICHVIPNHAIMIMTVLYASDDFDEAMHIINTCGWDTDCNSGNVGCLVAIMLGLSAFKGPFDWRGPLADRALISSADGGYSINNAARIAFDIANIGRRLAGHEELMPPKGGAQFHFSLPGSTQGFQLSWASAAGRGVSSASLQQRVDSLHGPGLAIDVENLDEQQGQLEVLTPTFTPKEVLQMKTYELMASPLVYAGQTVTAKIRASGVGEVVVGLRLKVYSQNDDLITVDGPCTEFSPEKEHSLTWTIPDEMDSQPIQMIGIIIRSGPSSSFTGAVWLDSLSWTGVPNMVIRPPSQKPCEFWHRAWVNGVDTFSSWAFIIAQGQGEGIIIHGTREWDNYSVTVPNLMVKLGAPAGLAIRVQGLNRYYAVFFTEDKKIALVKALDKKRIELASAAFPWELDRKYRVALTACDGLIRARVDDVELQAIDGQYGGGGIGLVATDGCVSADCFIIAPVI